MLRLRPYKPSDGAYLMEWLKDERTLHLWRADRFHYPLDQEQLNQYWNDFLEDEQGWIWTALEADGTPAGHFSMRRADYEKECIHMGFIVVNPECRGKGYGREMVNMALEYAFGLLKMKRVTLGVFSNNEAAHKCYLSAGFGDLRLNQAYDTFHGEVWDYYNMAADK